MQFTLSREMITHDPTQGIKQAKAKSDGFYAWEEEDIGKYRAFHDRLDSKSRLALELLLNTIQRRGDVIRLGKQHLRDDVDDNGQPIKVLHFRQQKTGERLDIPVLPELQAVLDLVPADQLTFLVTRRGQPYSGNDFSEQFRGWCDEAGLPAACSAHGLRKAGAIRLALAGCSTKEIAAWGGWKSLHEVERYTLAAEQRRLARNAAARLLRGNEAATPTVKTPDPFYKKGV
jgi:integrase